MSGLLIEDGDIEDIDAAVARRDVGASGQALLGWDFFTEGPKGLAKIPARFALVGDDAKVAVAPGLGELSAMVQRRDQANAAGTEPGDPNLDVNKTISERMAEIKAQTDADIGTFKRLGPDPMTASLAGMTMNGLGDYVGRAAIGTVAGGPAGGAALLAATEFSPRKLELMDEGVDEQTAQNIAFVDTGAAALGALAPAAFGRTLLTKLATGAALNVPLGFGQRELTSDILRKHGYEDMAERYKGFDATSIAIDAVMGAGFGLLHTPDITPEMKDAAMVARDAQRRDLRSPRGMPLNNAADRQIAAADLRAQEQMARGEPIDVADIFDEGAPATLADLEGNIEPWVAPENVVQSMLEWQRSAAPDAPMSLTEFIKSIGGIKTRIVKAEGLVPETNAGELEALTGGRGGNLGSGVPGLINDRRGMQPDDVARAAWEAGYLGNSETWDLMEFYELLRQDIAARSSGDKTKRIYQHEDDAYLGELSSYDALSQDAARLGIKKNHSEATVRDILSRSEFAQRAGDERPQYAEIDPHEAERAELMDHLVAAFREDPAFAENADMLGDLGDDPFADLMASRGDLSKKDMQAIEIDAGQIVQRRRKLREINQLTDGEALQPINYDQGREIARWLHANPAMRKEFNQYAPDLWAEYKTKSVGADPFGDVMASRGKPATIRDPLAPTEGAAARVYDLSREGQSNKEIAKQLREEGFTKATPNSVAAMKSQMRAKGVVIPHGKSGRLDPAQPAGMAAADLKEALAASFGKSTEKLLASAKIEILSTVAELNAVTGRTLPDDTKAVHARGAGKTFIVAENMSPELVRGVVLHEVGVHHGLEQMIGARGMEALRGQLEKLADHPAVRDAVAAAEAFALKPEHVPEETIAYLVENHADLPMVQRLLAQIRQWLWRAFPGLVDLTPADIQAMAAASLRRVANSEVRGYSGAVYRGMSQPMKEGWWGKSAYFFSDNSATAATYGDVARYSAQLKRPLVIDAGGARFDNIPLTAIPAKMRNEVLRQQDEDGVGIRTDDVVTVARYGGGDYDGVIFKNILDEKHDPEIGMSGKPATTYAIFDPAKSVVGDDLTDLMTSFGGGLDTPEGRRAWANSSAVLRVAGGNDVTYTFESPGGAIDVQFHREHNGAWGIVWDWSKNTREDNKFADGTFDGKPFQSLGKIIGVIERFIAQGNPEAIHFAGLSNAHTKLYSRMIMAVMPDGWRAWDVSGEHNRAHEFAITRADVDVKASFPQATPIEKVLTNGDISAKSERAKDFGVRAYLDWFRDSGGDELTASRGGKKKAPRDENTADMFDPVKAAIADDPSLTVPDATGKDLPAEQAIEAVTEEVKAAQELSKGFEAAGACAARHAMGLAHAADKKVAAMFGSLTGGAVAGGVIANAAVPALKDANDAQRAAEIEASAKKDQERIVQERETFQRENPVTSIPMGRDMDNTAEHVGERFGVPADFMHALALHESGGDPNAEATTSSAVGATQFLEETWKIMLRDVGDELGFKGDPESQEALDLRKDQRWAMAVGAKFAQANARDLKASLGRDPTQKEVYLAHFMGVAGAKKLIKAAAEGVQNAASVFPSEAAANASVFRGSAQDVIDRQGRDFSDAPFKVSKK